MRTDISMKMAVGNSKGEGINLRPGNLSLHHSADCLAEWAQAQSHSSEECHKMFWHPGCCSSRLVPNQQMQQFLYEFHYMEARLNRKGPAVQLNLASI